MKKSLNRWTLGYIALIVFGASTLALHFFVFAQEERERLVLAFILIVAGGAAILGGFTGLVLHSIRHFSLARKAPIQSPVPTRGNGT